MKNPKFMKLRKPVLAETKPICFKKSPEKYKKDRLQPKYLSICLFQPFKILLKLIF